MKVAVTSAVVNSVEVSNDVFVKYEVMDGGVDFIYVYVDCTIMVDVTCGDVDAVVTNDSGSENLSVTLFDWKRMLDKFVTLAPVVSVVTITGGTVIDPLPLFNNKQKIITYEGFRIMCY